MTYNNNTINNNNSNVNAWDIEYIIKAEEKEELLKSAIKKERFEKVRRKKMAFERQCPELFALVPECQKTAVAWQIKHFFKNDPELYCLSVSKFFTFFDKKKKAICDEAIALGDEERKKKNKLRKDYLLYSSQLLGLVGGAYGSRYINDALLNIYVDDQKAQQDFYDAFRLVNAKGNVRRLVPLEKKKEVQRARLLNISSAMAQIAIDKGFTFSLITFTLPPVFHNNAIKGSSASYQGFLPSDGQKFLERMGQEFRALLAKRGMKAGENYFGCSVFEAMKSSVGHKHYLIYTAKDDVHYLREIIEGMEVRVRNEYQCLYNIDMKENDGRNGSNGASYIFKYITKTLGELEGADDTQKRNMAVRWYHSARAFNFFGIKQAVTKFNFLCDCVEQYKGYYSDQIYNALSNYNYYEFITKFEQYFKIERDENNKVKFVKFDLAGNFRAPQLKEMMKAQVIIEKKVFSVFECPVQLSDVMCLKDLEYKDYMSGAFDAWDDAKHKQKIYSDEVKAFAVASGIPSYVAGVEVNLSNVMNKHYPRWKEEIKSFFSVGVTVKEKLSRENLADQSAIPILEEKTVYSPRLSNEINEKIRKLIDERRKAKGLIQTP